MNRFSSRLRLTALQHFTNPILNTYSLNHSYAYQINVQIMQILYFMTVYYQFVAMPILPLSILPLSMADENNNFGPTTKNYDEILFLSTFSPYQNIENNT